MKPLRRFYPSLYPCPRCKSLKFSLYSHKGNLQSRRCQDCSCAYKVSPIAYEVEDPNGGTSRIVLCT